jgi:3-oxoacyl-[acyl-carrier protein] reductase
MKLKGRIAVVTGASRGIGKAISIALAKEGCAVGLMARTAETLSTTAQTCREFGAPVFALPVDLESPLAAVEGLKLLTRELGGLDILINNAGTGASGSIEELELEDYDRVMNLNLRSVIALCKQAIPNLKQSEQAAIINIASVAGTLTYPGGTAYATSKHAVRGFTACLFDDIREHGIKVSAISPGYVNTDMVQSPKLDSDKMIQTQDIVDALMYLLNASSTVCPTEIILRPQIAPYIQE